MKKKRWRKVKQKSFDYYLNNDVEEIVLKHISLFDRFKIFITDTFMILMPIMYIVFYIVMGSREEFAQHMGMGWIYILVPHFIITIIFWSVGQTPGMKAYEAKIVNRKTGKKPSIFLLIIRYIVTTINILTIFAWIMPLFSKDRLTLQDFISNTTIVYE